MLAQKSQLGNAELLWNLERQIVQRTLGRVRDLHVETQDDRVIVRGFTPSYFMKQLAIQAALEVLDREQRPRELDMQLDVLPRNP
jgi:hypothetical protein